MNKVKNITITALACFSFGGAIVATNSLTNAVPTVAAASQENIDIAPPTWPTASSTSLMTSSSTATPVLRTSSTSAISKSR